MLQNDKREQTISKVGATLRPDKKMRKDSGRIRRPRTPTKERFEHNCFKC